VEIRGLKQYFAPAHAAAIETDLVGLLLLGLAFSLILLALNLAPSANGGRNSPSMTTMLVVGFAILTMFIAYEALVATVPIIRKRILADRAFLAALMVNVFNQMSSATRNNYFSSYINIIKPWSNYAWTVFHLHNHVATIYMSPIGGLIHRATHR
jgi:hypothetical protein